MRFSPFSRSFFYFCRQLRRLAILFSFTQLKFFRIFHLLTFSSFLFFPTLHLTQFHSVLASVLHTVSDGEHEKKENISEFANFNVFFIIHFQTRQRLAPSPYNIAIETFLSRLEKRNYSGSSNVVG